MTFGEVGCFLSHYFIWQKVSRDSSHMTCHVMSCDLLHADVGARPSESVGAGG